ncbi:corticotropin-releasing factor-binding protein isoform X2 [Bacillus rossius redtenbacheri]|uniref:corticotropin-releasing factor-binding protein isoform X2 n=1 Tax=Bacillus rossius redtenbacheri TaxID=93214 RepID=UPI002FDD2E0D
MLCLALWLLPAAGLAASLPDPQMLLPEAVELSADRPAERFRTPYHIIKDCMTVSSEDGRYFHKAGGDEAAVCGVYLLTDPDRTVEFVDGWEMNRQFFPSPSDHPKPLALRYHEFCGGDDRKLKKQVFESSQNAALVQYRIPARGKGFSFSVRFPKNSTPCNILLEGAADVYTLRNYGKRANCSLTSLYPAAVKVLSLDVGLANPERGLEVETGTLHKCRKRGLPDYVELGGSEGLDTSRLVVADSVCGLDSKPGSTLETILCEVTTVRLVSSGQFDNSVTVSLRQAGEEDVSEAALVCGY